MTFDDTAGPGPVQHRLPHHPLSNDYPMMSEAEIDALAEDIKENGQREPITVYQGQILDGRNRDEACHRAGVDPVTVEYTGDDPAAFVTSANLHRRHLKQAQKQEVIAKVLAAHPEWSDRAIAKLAQVDHKTVGTKRAALEERGEIPHVETRSDTKGRSVAVGKKKRDAGSASPRSAIKLAATPENQEANAFVALASVLRQGEINRKLNKLWDVLDEEEQIAELPKIQRAILARRILDRLEISADDLPPITDAPASPGALH
jgi:ParB-like chromosome segregation protein Spo0J